MGMLSDTYKALVYVDHDGRRAYTVGVTACGCESFDLNQGGEPIHDVVTLCEWIGELGRTDISTMTPERAAELINVVDAYPEN